MTGTTVHVPVRIRIDPERLQSDPAALEDAVTQAVSRALVRSRGVVPGAGDDPYTLGEPEFNWSGDQLSPTQRMSTEQLLRDAIAVAAASLRTRYAEPPRGPIPVVPTDLPHEQIDPERLVGGGYELPSYSDPDDELIHVFVDLAEDAEFTVEWLKGAIKDLSEDWGEPDRGSHPGVMWMHEGAVNAYFLYENDTRLYHFYQRMTEVWQDGKFVLEPAPWATPWRSTLEVVATFEDGDVNAYKEFLRKRDGDSIRVHITDDAAFEAEITKRANRMVKAHIQTVMDLTIGNVTGWYAFPEAEPVRFKGTASLLPFTRVTTRAAEKAASAKGTGTSRGIGKGDDAGSGEDEGGHGEDDEGQGTGAELRYGAPLFAFGEAQQCESFLGEPTLTSLPDGASLVSAVDTIAHKLQIEPCYYAGQFCLMAAQTMRAHVAGLADAVALNTNPAITEYRKDKSGNLGEIEMRTGGVNILLHRLAATVPLIEYLARDVKDLYQAHSDRLTGMYEKNSAGWELHFNIELQDSLDQTVAFMFGQTCRLLMIQLLAASRVHIDERLEEKELGRLAHAFYTALLPELITIDELVRLKERLDDAQDPYDVTDEGYAIRKMPDPDVTYVDDRGVSIRDKRGRKWTLQQLDDASHVRRGFAEELEPLIKHIRDIHESVAAMRTGEEGTKQELRRILEKMVDANEDVRGRVLWSWEDAFKYAQIDDNLPGDSPAEIGRSLRGIHLLAHNELAPHFGGSEFYARGVRYLFEGEHAIEVVKSLLELGVLVVVSVLCPPAGAALGVGLAAVHLLDTIQKAEIRDALLSPEQVVDLAELEVEEFVAALGLALAVIPEAGSVIRGAYRAGAVAIEEGALIAGARFASAAVRRAAVEGMRKTLEEGFAKVLAKELVKVEIINTLVSHALAPVADQIYQQAKDHQSPGGVQGALAIIAWHHRQIEAH